MNRRLTHVVSLMLALALVLPLMLPGAPTLAGEDLPEKYRVSIWLTLLHNNDGESQLIDLGGDLTDFGGAARFKTVVENLREEAYYGPYPLGIPAKRGVLMLSSGDNFLAGPEFNVSLEKGVPYYDTIAMDLIGYNAVAIGNHDFDFGPDVLANFIEGYELTHPTYLSSNLIFDGEPTLAALEAEGRIAASTVRRFGRNYVGIIGATTPNLPFISSPRDVEVLDDVAGAIMAEVEMLQEHNVGIIVLISHLQNINEDLELATMLDGVDIMIAGGGDELLWNEGTEEHFPLVPGDEEEVFGSYPMIATDMDGTEVPVVTTKGSYGYVGKLVAGFDRYGNLLVFDGKHSGPVRVAGGDNPDAVMPDPVVQEMVVDPLVEALDELASTVIGTSEVDLDGRRSSVRSEETNEGNLIADALRWQASELAAEYGVQVPDVGLQNGGGIRNDSIISAGEITELDTFGMVPFPNFVSVLEDIPREQFKEIVENAVACTQGEDFDANPNCGSGRFAQISGFSFVWDPAGVGQILDDDGNVTTPGTRVVSVMLDDGTMLVDGGAVVAGDPITVATIDFLARGGDQYPYRGHPFTSVGVSYQQALSNYIQDGLGGLISEADYPEGGEGRIAIAE